MPISNSIRYPLAVYPGATISENTNAHPSGGRSRPTCRKGSRRPPADREGSAANRVQRSLRLRQVEPVVSGGEPERQVVALGAALGMYADPAPAVLGRAPPQRDVRRAERFEHREELVGAFRRAVQHVGPQTLVVADQRRLV